MTLPLLDAPIRWWACPSCATVDKTQQAGPHTRFHTCPAMGLASIPLIEVETPDSRPDGRQLTVEREDYAGSSSPLAAIRTERGDGSNDVTVLAPTAAMSIAG